jgi:hypothetical protein
MVILSALSAGLSQGAIADPSSASASVVIDWSHLKFSVTGINGGIPAVEYTNPSTSLSSRASIPGISDTETEVKRNWTETISTDSSIDFPREHGHGQAQTSASSSIFSASTEVQVPSFFGSDYTSGAATGSRQIDFSLDGPGTIIMTVPYSLSMNVLNCGTGVSCDENHAKIDAFANFHDIENVAISSFTSSIVIAHKPLENEELSRSGNLALFIAADGAGSGSLSINFDIASAVPEPESYAMLLAGLGLVSFIARRRQRMG